MALALVASTKRAAQSFKGLKIHASSLTAARVPREHYKKKRRKTFQIKIYSQCTCLAFRSLGKKITQKTEASAMAQYSKTQKFKQMQPQYFRLFEIYQIWSFIAQMINFLAMYLIALIVNNCIHIIDTSVDSTHEKKMLRLQVASKNSFPLISKNVTYNCVKTLTCGQGSKSRVRNQLYFSFLDSPIHNKIIF